MEGHKFKGGKKLLQLCMGQNYYDSNVVYREYVQNACDSLYAAQRMGLIKNLQNSEVISVEINRYAREVVVLDRGTGVPFDKIGDTLVDIGASTKNGYDDIGNYGIGRLVGANWCDKIVFETSYVNENIKSILTFDAEAARGSVGKPICYGEVICGQRRLIRVVQFEREYERLLLTIISQRQNVLAEFRSEYVRRHCKLNHVVRSRNALRRINQLRRRMIARNFHCRLIKLAVRTDKLNHVVRHPTARSARSAEDHIIITVNGVKVSRHGCSVCSGYGGIHRLEHAVKRHGGIAVIVTCGSAVIASALHNKQVVVRNIFAILRNIAAAVVIYENAEGGSVPAYRGSKVVDKSVKVDYLIILLIVEVCQYGYIRRFAAVCSL